MTRAEWLDNLQLENITPLLDECDSRADAYEIFHVMARFHQTLIAEIWLRFGIANATPAAATISRPHTRPDSAAALAALDTLIADGGIAIMPIPSTDEEFKRLHKLLGD